MNKFRVAALAALALAVGLGDMLPPGGQDAPPFFGFVSQANAIVGRPLTPVSVAGTARRTTRRVIRRGAYIGAIPAGCPLGSYYGYSLYYCGGTYYQRSGSGYVIVYF
jgi:hypothetical protein